MGIVGKSLPGPVANPKKRNVSSQPSITSFFANAGDAGDGGQKRLKIVERFHEGHRICSCTYCGKYFTPQGIQSHMDDASERAAWSKDVHVSFQENAWVDTQTNLYGLEKWKEDLAGHFTSHPKERGQWFEDNLSSHKTDEVEEFWALPLSPPLSFLLIVDYSNNNKLTSHNLAN